jgi:hypothetical protein
MFVIPLRQKDEKTRGAGWKRFRELSNETPLVEVKLFLLINAIVSVFWLAFFFVNLGEHLRLFYHLFFESWQHKQPYNTSYKKV